MIDQIVIVISILAFLGIGFLFRSKTRSETVAEFTTNRDRLSWFPITAGISMTFVGGAAILNMASLSYTFGWYTLIDPASLLLGVLIVIFFIDVYRNDQGTTMADFLSGTSKKLSYLVGLITSLVFILIVAAQFVALSKLLLPFFPQVPQWAMIVILSTGIFSYVFFGGFTSVTKTDILQFFFIALFLLIPIILFVAFKTGATFEPQAVQYETMPVNLFILLGMPLLFIPLSQDINIRAKSARNKRHAVLGLLLGGIMYSSIVIASSFIGIYLKKSGINLADPEMAYTTFFQTHFEAIGIFAVLAALAAIVSSMDSYALNAISSVSKDLLGEKFGEPSMGKRASIRISGIAVFVIALSVALFFQQILALILLSLLIYVSVLLPIALARRLAVPDRYVFWSSVIAIAAIIGMEVAGFETYPKLLMYPSIGIILNGIGLLISKLEKIK
uniref:Na+/proline symporter n=1 Tax=Candidatus Kentrum sp. TUN TaxID=2126343 RepID=A0A451A2V1_9GAMM|nr:MAG: Na+/proline symporter [Candidatus Kentron sp. TUN]